VGGPIVEEVPDGVQASVNEHGETPEQEAFCDSHCCWSGHHKDCVRYDPPVGVAVATPGLRWRDELWELIRQYARRDRDSQRDADAIEIDAHLDALGVKPSDGGQPK
jgi:hypothetical protein